MRKFWAFIVIALCFAVLPSCNKDKDDDDEIKPSMSGELKYDLPAYAFAGEQIDLQASGVTYPEQSKITYRWTSQYDDGYCIRYQMYSYSAGFTW